MISAPLAHPGDDDDDEAMRRGRVRVETVRRADMDFKLLLTEAKPFLRVAAVVEEARNVEAPATEQGRNQVFDELSAFTTRFNFILLF